MLNHQSDTLVGDRFYALVDEMRQAREPAGSGKGGQFASKNSGAAVVAEMTATPATVGGFDTDFEAAGKIEESLAESYASAKTSADTMEPHEEENLEYYRGPGHAVINGYARNPEQVIRMESLNADGEAQIQGRIKEMDAVIDRSPPLPSDFVVYRGVGFEGAKALGMSDSLGWDVKSETVGKVLVDPAFISTSLAFSSAEGFAGGSRTVLEITVPKGSKALSMAVAENNTGDQYKFEYEMLLPRSSAMVVTGSRQEGNITIVEAKVMS